MWYSLRGSGLEVMHGEHFTHRVVSIIILMISFTLGPALNLRSEEVQGALDLPGKEALLKAQRQAVEWIKTQLVPNDVVPEPAPTRRRLLLSYRIPREDPAYPYLYGRSFLYDNALGVVALTMAGEYRHAEYILSAIKRLLRNDGSLWFMYNTNNSWPGEDDHDGAVMRMGAVAWFGYAVTYYLHARGEEEATFLVEDTLAQGYLEMAEAIAGYILQNQVIDPADRRYGLVTGGWGDYEIKINPGSGTPVEEYVPSRVPWVSMEHNIDIYFFLRGLHTLTGDERYRKGAELVRSGLLGLWSEEHGQLYRGIRSTGVIDTALPLDGASWAALFLISIGEEEKAGRCLGVLNSRFLSKHSGITGYRPYSSEPVYEDVGVNRYYYPDHPGMLWKDLPFVWGEGSCGAAAALIRAGKLKEGAAVLNSMLSLRVDGGFRYASASVPYQFSDYTSVASTAWFIIAVELLKGGRMAAIFWGE